MFTPLCVSTIETSSSHNVMCGIAGILKLDGARPEAHRLRRMRDVLTHRGPDGTGLVIDGPVGLAHTRLAIIDVAGGEQPMGNEDGSLTVVYNGEIYNHAALRSALLAKGHSYRSKCDTESILHLYEEEGVDAVESLQGMFAFALWDRPRMRLLLARDRLGIKPLYYAVTESELLFASEIKAILGAGSIRPVLNEDTLPEFLSTRFISSDETFFKGVRKLMPGHVLTWTPDERLQVRRYWQLPSPVDVQPRDGQSNASQLRAGLEAAVESHLMSDVPLGVFLSGGIDSSALAALVTHAVKAPIQTFAVGFTDPEANELPYARMAAAHIGAEHRDVTVSPTDFFRALPRLLWHEDEPIAFPSSVPLYFVARLARDHVKVVLTGEGADELFLGYNRYRVTAWNARLGRPYWAAVPPAWRREVRSAVHSLPSIFGRIARRTFLALDPGIRDLYLENFAVVPIELQHRLLRRRDLIDRRDPYAVEMRCFEDSPGAMLDRLSRIDLQTYLLELLMKQDQMSMAASIESRVPFLDDRLVAHMATMPGSVKLPGWQTKTLLRQAVRDLIPHEILTRRKMGFPVPMGRWLREGFTSLVDEFVLGPRASGRGYFDRAALQQLVNEHRNGWAAHTDRLWLLINFEIWLRIFCDGESPDTVMDRPLGLAATSSPAASRVSHANPLGKDGRPLAVHNGWARS